MRNRGRDSSDMDEPLSVVFQESFGDVGGGWVSGILERFGILLHQYLSQCTQSWTLSYNFPVVWDTKTSVCKRDREKALLPWQNVRVGFLGGGRNTSWWDIVLFLNGEKVSTRRTGWKIIVSRTEHIRR